MKTAFVIMKTYDSPVAIVYPVPHSVVIGSTKDATERVDMLNSKATRNHYYAVKVKAVEVAKGGKQ